MLARHDYVEALPNALYIHNLGELRSRATSLNSYEGTSASSLTASANRGPGGRKSTAIAFALTMVLASSIMAQPPSANPPADRIREMEQLIDAVASHNEAPKLVGKKRFAYPIFSEKFDWNDQRRVKAAVWTLAQDDSNDLWGCLVEHFHDKRYSATCRIDENYPWNYEVGDICAEIARDKLLCAYLRHLEPGKTFHYGGPTHNRVSEDSPDFLPDSLQRMLHYSPQFYHTDRLAGWYQTRNSKPLYELQIEVCEWAVQQVEDAPGVAEKPKKQFVTAIGLQIESLKKTKKPVVDTSPWASPMANELGWKFYSMESALSDRDDVLNLGKESECPSPSPLDNQHEGKPNPKPE